MYYIDTYHVKTDHIYIPKPVKNIYIEKKYVIHVKMGKREFDMRDLKEILLIFFILFVYLQS